MYILSMKKIILLICLCCALAAAEENKHKWIVDVGGGFAFWSTFTDFGLGMRAFDSEEVEDEIDGGTNCIVVNLGARYQLAKMLELGFATGYEYYASKVHPYHNEKGYLKYADIKDNHIVHLAVESKVDWVSFLDHVQIYSRLGLGGVLEITKVDDYEVGFGLPNFQFSPIGIEYVGTVGFYAEAGVGYRGLYSGGVSFRF